MPKLLILSSVALLLAAAVFAQGAIPQDPEYHVFADARTVFGLPNAVNVLSNVPLLLAGAWGLALTVMLMRLRPVPGLLIQYALFFGGVLLSGIGSMYYHIDPSNASLVWDRLPMSIAFMALLASVISETMDRRAGSFLHWPLLAAGIISVLYWSWTENAGRGDLRLYALVQFIPVVLIPLILVLYRPPREYAAPIWLLAGLYVLAKASEVLDREVFVLTRVVSGHTIKHILAAAGVGFVVRMMWLRRSRVKE